MSPIIVVFIMMFVLEHFKEKQEKNHKKEEEVKKQQERSPFKIDDLGEKEEKGFFAEFKEEVRKIKAEIEAEENQDYKDNSNKVLDANRIKEEKNKVENQNRINREKREADERSKEIARAKRDLKDQEDKDIAAISSKLGKKNMRNNVVLGVMFSEILGEPKSKTRRR